MVTTTTGSPPGLRGLPDANDPKNLIRVMPAEGSAEHGSYGIAVWCVNPLPNVIRHDRDHL
jgi:hypothetical protein